MDGSLPLVRVTGDCRVVLGVKRASVHVLDSQLDVVSVDEHRHDATEQSSERCV